MSGLLGSLYLNILDVVLYTLYNQETGSTSWLLSS